MKDKSKQFLLVGDQTNTCVPVNLWGDAANLGINVGDRVYFKNPGVSQQGGITLLLRDKQKLEMRDNASNPPGKYRNIAWSSPSCVGKIEEIQDNAITTIIGSIIGIKNIGAKMVGKEGRLNLVIEVKEGKKEVKVMAFGEVAERILGISSKELKAKIEVDDPTLKDVFAAVNEKKMLFVISKPKQEEYLPTVFEATPEFFTVENPAKKQKGEKEP